MLEYLLARMAANAHPPELLAVAESAVAHVEQEGIQQYPAVRRPKAKIHTYLAWQKEPGSSLKLAISQHYLEARSENIRPFVDWVKRLLDV